MRFPSNKYLIRAVRVTLGGLFLYSGSIKMADPLNFADSVATFEIFSPSMINFVALILPPFETIAGITLVFGRFWRQAALVLLFLILLFLVLLAQALFRGIPVDCGCFGYHNMSTGISIGKNLLLVAGCTWLLFPHSKERGKANEE